MKLIYSITLILLLTNTSLANDCRCIFKSGNQKQTTETRKHWWGTSIDFYCDYNCTVDGVEMLVRANHQTWWTGKEQGNEFICEGTVYEQKYSTATSWFYYAYVKSKAFSPTKSKSHDLKDFANQVNCQ